MDVPTASVAATTAPPQVLGLGLMNEAQRQFDICNACRYCEGLCAVFPALERRSIFTEGDVLFIANLCHDCRECFDVCPYATPHEFRVDLPPLMSAVREQTYASYARPKLLGTALMEAKRARAWLSVLVLAFTVVLGLLFIDSDKLVSSRVEQGSFYEVVPFAAMTIPAFALSGLAIVFMFAGLGQFWRDTANRSIDLASLKTSLHAAFSMKNMRGGGPGCTYPEERLENRRLVMHSLVFYGFLGTFVATVLAAVWQEFLGQQPPYPLVSPPVVTGTLGGLATITGGIGLLALKVRSRPELSQEGILRLDREFIILLLLVNATGLGLLIARSTSAMGLLLLLHLGLIAAFFVSLPYGKFVHATYRTGALLQDALEAREDRGS